MKPHQRSTVVTLLHSGVSQREICRKTGIDRKTIRKLAQEGVAGAEANSPMATGSPGLAVQIPPPWPPAPAPSPPRRHRHRYFGVLAPNAPLRSAVTALANPGAETPAAQTPAAAAAAPPPAPASASAETAQEPQEPIHRRAARYAWALLLARIYEVFPLLCPKCGGEMRIIAFITEAPAVREILAHRGRDILLSIRLLKKFESTTDITRGRDCRCK